MLLFIDFTSAIAIIFTNKKRMVGSPSSNKLTINARKKATINTTTKKTPNIPSFLKNN